MARFEPVEELFKGRHFDQEIVALCVRWYLSFKLSYRDLVTMMPEIWQTALCRLKSEMVAIWAFFGRHSCEVHSAENRLQLGT
jgi:hypothetical protein